MAVDMFLKIAGIDGESTDAKHPNEIDIESFSFGMNNPGSFLSGGGSAGKVEFQDFHFVMYTSKASPKLLLACASGQHITNAVFTLRKAGVSAFQFLKWTLTDILVSSFQEGGTTSGVPTEEVSLSFAKIEIDYTEQNNDGSAGATTSAVWDLKANKAG